MASFQTDLRAGPLDLDTSKHKIVTNIMLKALISTNHQILAIQHRKWSICSCLLSQFIFSAGHRKFESLSVIWSLTEEMMMRFLMRGGEGENWSTTRRPLVLPCDLVCTQRLHARARRCMRNSADTSYLDILLGAYAQIARRMTLPK